MAAAKVNELTAPHLEVVAASRSFVPRDQFFAGLYILGCANGLVGRILLSSQMDGWAGLLDVDISVIVLLACFAGVSTTLEQDREEVRSLDLAIGGGVLILVTLPVFALSWLAVAGLSLYIVLFANGGSDRARGAIIFLVLTIPMLWSRLLMQFFAMPILSMDASLAAWLLGTNRVGNTVGFADGSGYMVVTPACSSLDNVSLAVVCWISIAQWAKHRWSSKDVYWGLLVCGSVLAANTARIALTGLSHSNYEAIHNPTGSMIWSVLVLSLTVGIAVLSARRDVFPRI